MSLEQDIDKLVRRYVAEKVEEVLRSEMTLAAISEHVMDTVTSIDVKSLLADNQGEVK